MTTQALQQTGAAQERLYSSDIGLAGATYIAGAVLGALLFGWLTDRLGRRRVLSPGKHLSNNWLCLYTGKIRTTQR